MLHDGDHNDHYKGLHLHQIPNKHHRNIIHEVGSSSRKRYAMKCLDKKRIKLKNGESMAIKERAILSRVSAGDASPFIVCMTYAFQTPEKLFFILDLMNGGDLNYHLSQHGTFSEEEVKFYAAEVILGLEHMHDRKIVYRDLKPANILLDECGHVRISDLGLTYDVSENWPSSAVGTNGYTAPEVLQKGTPYAFSADWYSLGCTVYKLLVGICPFRQYGSKGRFSEAPTGGQRVLQIPDSFADATKAFLIGLLQTNVDVRLGSQGRGSEELKHHTYLASIDWELARRQQLVPPLVPPKGEINAADAFEIGAFDEEDTQGIRLTPEDQDIYKDFDVVIADRWQHEMTTTIFDAVNAEFDQVENKRRQKLRQKLRQLTQVMSIDAESPPSDPPSPTAGAQLPPLLSSTADLTPQPSIDADDIPSWPADLLLEWWMAPESYGGGPPDCLVESELLRLGGSFLHAWQKKHVRLFPNRLEIYGKTSHGIPLRGAESISMLDIGSIHPTLQKVSKYDNVIIIVLKSQSKIFLTSQDRIVVDQWLWELLQAFQNSSQVLSTMSRKVYWIYGIDEPKLYAKATPSSSKEGHAGAPPPPTGVLPDVSAKRKQFKRMQSFQTALVGSRYFNNSAIPPNTASPPTQRPFLVDAHAGNRAILKNLNKVTFSKTVETSSDCPADAPANASPTAAAVLSGTSGNSKHN